MKLFSIVVLSFLFLNCKKETIKTEIAQQIGLVNEIKRGRENVYSLQRQKLAPIGRWRVAPSWRQPEKTA